MKTTGTKKALHTILIGGLTIGMLVVFCAPSLTTPAQAQNPSGYFGQGNAMAMAAIAEQEIREHEKVAKRTITIALNDEKDYATAPEVKETEEK